VNRQTTPPNAFFERIRDFAAFSGAAFFGAAFFVTAGFSGSAAAALLAAQRFFKAATICCLASGAELPLRFGSLRRDRRWSLRGLSPPFPLCVTDALPGGGTHLPPFAFWTSRRGGGRRGTTGEHGPEFGYLSIDTELLLFKTYDGGGDDFGCEFVGGHVSCGASILPFRPILSYEGGDMSIQ
jgi:hypothetical protein